MAKSSKNQKHLNVNDDRITSLPDPIIHHIFSYLKMREIVQTSILSNTWRYLWMSTPTLNFIFDEWKPRLSSDKEPGKGFLHFVDSVIHRGTSSLEKLHFSYPMQITAVDVHGWLLLALARNVQHLFLELTCLDEFLELPREVFTSSVTQLKVKCFPKSLIGLPNTVSNAARVKSMVLKNVKFPDGNDKGELILSCPVLEHLVIQNCGIGHLKMLSISTPLLERLNLEDLSRMKKASCTVKISIPTLKTLIVFGQVSPGHCNVHYCAENLSSLVSAYVDIYPSEECDESLIEVLEMVSNVQVLEVTVNSVLVLEDFPNLLERLPGKFPNLRYVMFSDGCENWSMNSFLNLLEKLPYAETFVWNRHQTFWTSPFFFKKGKDWEPNLPHQSIFSCLKRFEIWNFRGTEAEQKFLKFLLERAFVLEEVVIEKSSGMGKKIKELRTKLCSLPRASSNAVIRID
ncbi:hypothetical protein ACHQM5_012310 [Ranunculus cassubicifolius]